MTVTPRFEIKYLLGPSQYWSLCKALSVGFKRDRISSEAPNGRYLVNTVYFDSWDYREYFEKISGVFQRRKLRLRTYWDDGSEAPFINVEEKRREGSLISKHVARVACEEYRTFMKTMHWPDDGKPFLKRFETMVRLEDLRPKVVVRYQRDVFESRDGSGVRVSLDHDVR